MGVKFTVMSGLMVLICMGLGLACMVSGTRNVGSLGSLSDLEPGGQQDVISVPAIHQRYESPDGDYRFEVVSSDDWQSQQATGLLYRVLNAQDELLWRQTLPQEYGPRYVVVGPRGQVLLLDESINVASAYAVYLLDRWGEPIEQYSFDDLQRMLGVAPAEIVAQAQAGWWMSAAPELNAQALGVTIETAGKTLTIDLTTGQLGVSDE